MSAKSPTLTDIRNLINANHQEVQARLEKVEDQVRLTNGRVKALETAEAVAKGIQEYKANQQTSRRWDITTIILFLTALAALVGALWWLKG